jgi:hypothetical protein
MTSPRGISVKQGGVWKEVKMTYFNSGGLWNPVEKGYVRRNGAWSQFFPSEGQEIFSTPATSGWTVPAGITSITVTVVAGGGGGGGSGTQYGPGGGGGGGGAGGAIFNATMPVLAGELLRITVGDGGQGAQEVSATSPAQVGEDGTTSSVTALFSSITAYGGKGGAGPTIGSILPGSSSVEEIAYNINGGAGGVGGNVALAGNATIGPEIPAIYSGQDGTDGISKSETTTGGAPGSRSPLGAGPIPYGQGGFGANSTVITSTSRPSAPRGNPGIVIINW